MKLKYRLQTTKTFVLHSDVTEFSISEARLQLIPIPAVLDSFHF